jgi:hypothetical protein
VNQPQENIMKTLIAGGLWFAVFLLGNTTGSGQTLPVENRSILFQEKSAIFYGREGTRLVPLQPSGLRLDYQSDLRIVVDTNELANAVKAFKASHPAPDSLPDLTSGQRARLERITEIGNAARIAVRVQDDFTKASELFKSNSIAENRKQLLELNRKFAASKVAFLAPLLSYCEAKVQAEKPLATDAQVATEGNALAERFVKIYPGDQYLYFDLPGLMKFAEAETKVIYDEAVRDAVMVQAAASISLRMRAFRQENEGDIFPLRIENYDSLTNANVKQEPRISFQPSERDLANLKSQKKAYEEGIKIIKDFKNKQSEFRVALDSALAVFQGDLRDWKSAVTNLDTLQSSLAPVIAALDKAGTSTQLTASLSNLIVQVKADLAEAKAEIKSLSDTVETFTEIRGVNKDSTEVLVAILKIAGESVDRISKLSNGADAKLGKILNNLKTISEEIAALGAQPPPNLQDLVNALKAGAPSSVEAIGKLKETAMVQYPALVAAFRTMWIKADQLAAAERSVPMELDPNLFDVSTVNPPEGLISLKANYVRGDAGLDFTAALISSNANSGQRISRQIENKLFSVEKFGLINTWSASLIFVKRLGDLDPTEEKSQFAPAPSVAWTLHYNPPPPKDGSFSKWEKTWQTLDPGWGINVATLDWNDSIQVGLGSHVSIFKDVITVGGGWNLNESRHGGYVFIGIGVFEAFGQLGLGKKTAVGR